jgi:hypothetical protein
MATRKAPARSTASGAKTPRPPSRASQAAALIGAARAARRSGGKADDLFWETVGRIVDDELHVELGYDSVDEFFEQETGEPARSARRKIRVARHAKPSDWSDYGPYKLDAALAFVIASRDAPLLEREQVRFDALKIPVVRGRVKSLVSLREAKLEEVEAASAQAGGKKPAKPRQSPSEALLADGFKRTAGLTNGSAAVRDGRAKLEFDLVHKDAVAQLLLDLPDTAEERESEVPRRSTRPASKALKKRAPTR